MLEARIEIGDDSILLCSMNECAESDSVDSASDSSGSGSRSIKFESKERCNSRVMEI